MERWRRQVPGCYSSLGQGCYMIDNVTVFFIHSPKVRAIAVAVRELTE